MPRAKLPPKLNPAAQETKAGFDRMDMKLDLIMSKLTHLYRQILASRKADGRMNAKHIAIYRERGLDMAPLLRKSSPSLPS